MDDLRKREQEEAKMGRAELVTAALSCDKKWIAQDHASYQQALGVTHKMMELKFHQGFNQLPPVRMRTYDDKRVLSNELPDASTDREHPHSWRLKAMDGAIPITSAAVSKVSAAFLCPKPIGTLALF